MSAALRKSGALFKIWLQEGLAYRANGVIWILTDAVPAIIMPFVWMASMGSGGEISGFNSSQFVSYYLMMLLLTNFITSHLMWELAYEIKEGIFTTHLLRPVSYFQVCFIRNLSWRSLRLMYFLPMFLVLLLLFRSHLEGTVLYLGWEVVAAVILGHLVSFSFVFMMSLLALFVQETESIFGLYYFPMLFLSGQLFPIQMLPEWAVSIARVFPFYYTTALPVEILIGRIPAEAARPLLLVQVAWITGHLLLAKLLWKSGLRHYTAVGM